tara:strand:+ start:7313 stop:8617 length:1305 start_codon:yes stop_codon:yes gene_type:complete
MSFGIDQLIDRKKKLFYGLPQEEMQRRAKISGGLLDALATEQVLAEKQAAKNAMTLAMQNDAKTVVQENEANLLGRTQQELAEGVSGVLKNKKNRMDQNLKRIAQMGIGGAKRPNMAAMAQGGIVGYFDGKAIDMENEEEEKKKRFITPGLGGIMQPNLKKLKEDAFTDIAERSGITPRESTITTDESGFVKGTDNFNEPTTQLGKYKPPVAKDRSKQEGIPFAGPTDPTDLFPQISTNLKDKVDNVPEEPKSGDSKEDLQSKEDAYNEWLEGLLTVLSAPASGRGLGGGNVARAYLQYSQRVFNNKAKLRELRADEMEAQAKMDLNKLSKDELSYSRLVGRQTNLLKIIQDVRAKAEDQFKFKILELNSILQDPKADQYDKEEARNTLRGIQNSINDIVEDSTERETALLKDIARRLRLLDFDESKGSKKLSR